MKVIDPMEQFMNAKPQSSEQSVVLKIMYLEGIFFTNKIKRLNCSTRVECQSRENTILGKHSKLFVTSSKY